MRYGQLVLGPAGSGKSTYCSAVQQNAAEANKTIDVVNLDPAAEHFDYDPLVDIRELIEANDAMEELTLGPNGGLLFCMDYLLENSDWLKEKLDDVDDDYILFDCPGQIELYTHLGTMRRLIDSLTEWGFRLCSVFLVDAQFVVDGGKFIGGTMAALSTMVNLELPHVNILSKVDLLSKRAKRRLDSYLEPDPHALLADLHDWGGRYSHLNEALGRLIEDFSLVRFTPLDVSNPDSLSDLQLTIDNIIQFGEDDDVKTHDFECPDKEEGDGPGPE